MDYPCPNCNEVFSDLDDLYDHLLEIHNSKSLITLEPKMRLTKDDFTQVDGHWVYVIGGFQMSLLPDNDGNFRLTVSGTVAPIPPATQYPSEPEWEDALNLANKFADAYKTASNRDRQN